MGLQHTENDILKGVNRGCTTEDAIKAIYLLKSTGFKVDAHLMPNLPNSSPELDRKMLKRMSTDSDLFVDQIKVYPCEIVPFTKIEKWFREGTYRPYPLNDLMEVLIEFKASIPSFVRLNRVVRDIPANYQCASGVKTGSEHLLPTNWRNMVKDEMKKRRLTCKCIRCREVGSVGKVVGDPTFRCLPFEASCAQEYFLSFENSQNIFAFCRLRVPKLCDNTAVEIFPELSKSALVRELHVYGELVPRSQKKINERQVQHSGLGTKLLLEAERIVKEHHPHCERLCVISGIGVREFYRSLGWRNIDGGGQFLAKDISRPSSFLSVSFRLGLLSAFITMVSIGAFLHDNNGEQTPLFYPIFEAWNDFS